MFGYAVAGERRQSDYVISRRRCLRANYFTCPSLANCVLCISFDYRADPDVITDSGDISIGSRFVDSLLTF